MISWSGDCGHFGGKVTWEIFEFHVEFVLKVMS